MTVQWQAGDTEMIYEYLNRRWYEETGAYPSGDEPEVIVLVSSILAELHDQVCPHAKVTQRLVEEVHQITQGQVQETGYCSQIPNPRNAGTLKTQVWKAGANRVLRRSDR